MVRREQKSKMTIETSGREIDPVGVGGVGMHDISAMMILRMDEVSDSKNPDSRHLQQVF
jgi:hypothetical protein